MIYFFLKGQSNIEQSLDLLKYLKNKNKEREKNKAYKIPIIFIKNGYGLIRVLDTPGLVLTKDLDASSKIIKKLNKELDNIHMIYFFLKGQSNIEQSINILKYIKNKNIEREKNK